MLKKLLILLIAILLGFNVRAQVNLKDTCIGMAMFYAAYSWQFNSGNLAKIFGGNSSIGGGFQYKTRTNWIIGAEGNYLFGGNVKIQDTLLAIVSTKDGLVIDANGYMASIAFYERGYSIYAKFGKILPFYPTLAPNRNCGITLMFGAGYIENKIRIVDQDGYAPQIADDYGKGYDRLNSGIAVNASLGYLFMSNTRLLNFYAGFEFIQAWTKSRRKYDFDRMAYDDSKYSSQFYGLKVCWFIPLYPRKPKEFYYY